MFKYYFQCTDKERFILKIDNMMFADRPIGKGLFEDLYAQGIHFRENGERVRGYYLYQSEITSNGRSQRAIRVNFSGSFVEKDDKLFFQVHIYPPLWVFLFFIAMIVLWVPLGRYDAMIIAAVGLAILGWSYYKSIKETAQIFDRMII